MAVLFGVIVIPWSVVNAISGTEEQHHAALYRIAVGVASAGLVLQLVQLVVMWRLRDRFTREGMRRVHSYLSTPLAAGLALLLISASATVQVVALSFLGGYILPAAFMPSRLLFWRPDL
jgi:hypothetical protein